MGPLSTTGRPFVAVATAGTRRPTPITRPSTGLPVVEQVVKNGPVPIYQQLKTLLLGAVLDGALGPHQRIPSERELGQMLGVSRMTVRQALTQLINEGVLYSRAGKGTFVADRKIRQPLEHLTSFTEEMRERGMQPSTRTLRQARVRSREAAEALRISPTAPVVLLERLRLADGEPMAIECAYLNAARCPGLEQIDLHGGSLYELLREKYGLVLRRADQSIEAALPSPEQRALLGMSPRDPVLHIERVTYLDDGTPLEFVSSTYRGDRYRLQVELNT